LVKRTIAAAASLLLSLATPAAADNPMGYRLLSAQEAAGLPHNHGALGLDVERSQQIAEAGMVFDIMRVRGVRAGSPGAQAGLKIGDQIIAVDGRVFPSIAVFAAYIGSLPPGRSMTIDEIPAGGGPQQAQRITVATGGAGGPAPPVQQGMSTTTKIEIGAAAAALLGCYELGCFSHRPSPAAPSTAGAPR
jgi:hypothetical protein